MIKKSIHQHKVIILNVYMLNKRALKYMEQKLIEFKEEINKTTTIVRYFNTSLSIRP